MTTTSTRISYIHSDTTAVSVDTEVALGNSYEMTGECNVVVTQDSIDTAGHILSQDTITSVDFDESQDRDNKNSGDATSKSFRQLVSPTHPHNDADEAIVDATLQQPLSPPPLLVQCPNVNDVLFPMEGFTMWPGNMYCNRIIQQYQSKLVTSSQNKADQAQIILEIIHLIQSQHHSSTGNDDDSGSGNIGDARFLKAIQVPYRKSNENQNSNHKNNERQRFNIVNDSGDAIPSKTIWEVMHESDVLIQLSKILAFDSNANHANATASNIKKDAAQNEESQISTSAMAILQGLYYVPNYYPSRSEKRPHEYRSGDEETEGSYCSSSEEDDDGYESMSIKRRRVVHRKVDDYKPIATKTSKSSFQSNKANKTSNGPRNTSSTKSSVTHNARPQHLPPVKVSMIGRIMVPGADHGTAAPSESSSRKSPHNSDTNNHRVNFQYKPKPMKSHQAMFEQEGLECLPKGVTVRPSGKWQAQTYFAGQSRYVGVYDTSFLAARAYNVVQDYLRKYRIEYKITKETPKEALTSVFADARRIADDAVQRLRRDLNMADVIDDEVDTSVDDTAANKPSLSVSQENPPATLNVIPPLEEPPLEKGSTAVTTAEPTDVVDASPNKTDFENAVPTSSASQVDTSTQQNGD